MWTSLFWRTQWMHRWLQYMCQWLLGHGTFVFPRKLRTRVIAEKMIMIDTCTGVPGFLTQLKVGRNLPHLTDSSCFCFHCDWIILSINRCSPITYSVLDSVLGSWETLDKTNFLLWRPTEAPVGTTGIEVFGNTDMGVTSSVKDSGVAAQRSCKSSRLA